MLWEAPLVLLRVHQRLVREHVELPLRALLNRRLVSRLLQLGRETRGPRVVAVSNGAVLNQDARHNANLPALRGSKPAKAHGVRSCSERSRLRAKSEIFRPRLA